MQKIKRFFSNISSYIKAHKRIFIPLFILFILVLLFVIYLGIGALQLKGTITKLQADGTYIKQQQQGKSYAGIVKGIENIRPDLNKLQTNLHYYAPISNLPVVSGYYANAQHMLNAIDDMYAGALRIAKAATPVANTFGYGDNPVQGSGKIGAFVQALPQLTPAIDQSMSDFNSANKEFNAINPKYIPNITIKGINLSSSYNEFKSSFNNLVAFLPKINTLAPVIQQALGVPNQTNYLLLFQNNKEIRATGGFISAFGYLTFTNGNLGEINSNDIYNLDKVEVGNPAPPAQLTQYNFSNTLYLRDGNLSPDVPTTAAEIERLYKLVPYAQRKPIDGVVFIDTDFVASLLNAVGPVYIAQYKQEVTAANAAYEMEYYAEKVDLYAQNRKEFINLLMEAIKQKVFSAQKDALLSLLNIGMNDITQKHISLYANTPSVEGAILQYNWGGQFLPPVKAKNDYFAMVEENLGGAKADFYIKRTISASIQKTIRGYLQTVDIKFSNDQVYDDWLNGPYKAWVRFYLPQGATLVSLTGTDGTLREYSDLQSSVIDDHIRVPVKYAVKDPAATLDVVLKYYLPATFTTDNGYSMYVYKQAGVPDEEVHVTYNGNTQSADILTDQEFSF